MSITRTRHKSPENTEDSGPAELVGQSRQIRWLTAALHNNRAPHAICFSGQPGVGKKTAAVCFAMAANCTARPDRTSDAQHSELRACGRCRSCKKIASGNHPDFHRIFPSGAYIRIDQIRHLCRSLALKPYEAAVRVVLIADAHQLNAEAGNALLKALEEPPANTVFILTAPQTTDLLPTIVSRCQHLRFNPVPQAAIETYLGRTHGMDVEHAMVVASLAGGSFTRASEIADAGWVARRDRIVEALEQLGRQSVGRHLDLSEMLAQQRGNHGYIFEIMKNWFRDLSVIKYRPDLICNRDLHDRLASAEKRFTLPQLVEKTAAVESAERAIAGNANVQLTLDTLVLKLAKQESND